MPPDYSICYECGFVLRLFDVRPEERKSFGVTQKGRDAVEQLVKQSGIAHELRPPGDVLVQLRDHLLQGLMLQLRSIPIGLRVDSWIRRQFPELVELQEASVKKQMQENAQAMAPQVRQLAPEKIYRANVAMNGSFALFWAQVLQEPRFTLPYKASKYWATVSNLMSIFEQVPDVASEDCRLVDAWAEELGLAGWYEWFPYECGGEASRSK